jgi:histidyl-tRNA synthetase
VGLKHQAPRGTRDLLPDELPRWQWAEARARDVLTRYGYREIRTPLFEEFELFARTSGEASDVVQKEMYRFKDLGDRDLALRPEFTAGVLRAYLEHGLSGQGRIHRLWSMGPVFRYGRPQKGRYRQFFQLNAEVIGSAAPGADVEVIALFVDLFEAWGFANLTVTVNSLGTPATRRAYGEALTRWLEPVASRLSADSQARLLANPLRVLDTKDPKDQEAMRSLSAPMPQLIGTLDDAARAHWEAVLAGLAELKIAYDIDHGLVRGLDYYTHTAFEVHDRSLGAQSALGGGGRYDGLIEMLGGPATPGVGFAIGLDRALLVLEERGFAPPPPAAGVYVVAMDSTRAQALSIVRELRRDFTVDLDLEGRAFGAQMKSAGKSGARWALILGDDEVARGEVTLKDLESGEQTTFARFRLVETLHAAARPPAKEPR